VSLTRRAGHFLRSLPRLSRAAVEGARVGVKKARSQGGPRKQDRRQVVVGVDGKTHRLGARPRPEPPECPPGWTVGAPDFVIVGAEKSGTSRWLRILRNHPDVHIATGGREIHFWDDFMTRWPTQQDIERYHSYFPRPPGARTGEKTPQYMSLWWAPRLLAMAAPDAAIVVMVRDPVERYVSGRTQLEKYRPADASRQKLREFERRAVELSMHRGQYALQLDWLRLAFPPERILVLQHEACIADTQGQLDRTLAHIGLPAWTVPFEVADEPVNAAWLAKVPLEDERRALLRDLYRPEVARLKAMVPDLDLSLWPNYADLAGATSPWPVAAASDTAPAIPLDPPETAATDETVATAAQVEEAVGR
jgi:hypothetical protein